MKWFAGVGLCLAVVTTSAWADYADHARAQAFVDSMVEEHGFAREPLRDLLAETERRESILAAIAAPAERVRAWHEYRPIFITDERVAKGVAFWREHREALARAQDEYGVPAQVIVAIIGVETNYGGNMGGYRVMDALATLAFDYPPRSPFFTRELEHYLLLAREQEREPLAQKGSYAGAMGYGQFMPSSYRAYAVDFDGDGRVDIWGNINDAVGSVANYFASHGWRSEQPVAIRARTEKDFSGTEGLNSIQPPTTALDEWRNRGVVPIAPMGDERAATLVRLEGDHGEEYWFGFHNFYVITRYNRSHMYAMATYQLSRELRRAMQATDSAEAGS